MTESGGLGVLAAFGVWMIFVVAKYSCHLPVDVRGAWPAWHQIVREPWKAFDVPRTNVVAIHAPALRLQWDLHVTWAAMEFGTALRSRFFALASVMPILLVQSLVCLAASSIAMIVGSALLHHWWMLVGSSAQ